MLSEEEVLWLVNAAKRWRATLHGEMQDDVDAHIKRIEAEIEKPLELLIFCPVCKKQHVDEGAFLKPHKRHSCQYCGLLFSVTKDLPNVGVQFFEGCRDAKYTITSVGEPTVSMPILRPGETCEVVTKV